MRCFFVLMSLLLLSWPAEAAQNTKKGLWVSVVEEKSVLYDTFSIDELIEFSHANGFDTLFIQVYRADKAWFPSKAADESPFQEVMSRAGQNTFAYLINSAHEKGIEVHAWVNTLSIAQNLQAPVLAKYGKGVLTRDQNGRLPFEDPQESGKRRKTKI